MYVCDSLSVVSGCGVCLQLFGFGEILAYVTGFFKKIQPQR